MTLQERLSPFIADPEDQAVWARGVAGQPKGPPAGTAVLVASLFLNLFALGLPVVILQVYDRILPNQSTGTLGLLVLGLIVVLLLDALFRTIRAYITGWDGARYEHRANCAAVDRLLAANIDQFERDPPGAHLDRLMSVAVLRDFYAGQAKLLVVDLPFIGLFIGLIYVIADWLVYIPIGLFAVLGLASFAIAHLLRAALKDRSVLDDRRYSFVIETLSGLHTIKLLDMEAQMERRYERLQESTAAASYDVSMLGNLAQSVGWIFSNLTMIAVASAGAIMVIDGQLTMGALAACTMLAGRAVQPVLRALGLWTQYQGISIAKARLGQIYAIETEADAEDKAAPEISGAIQLENLSFAYDDESGDILQNVDLSLAAGEVVGISGDSGSGKTTLLMLMMGTLQSTGGRILVDGEDISRLDQQNYRSQIAVMPQTAVMFQGTILDNLSLFRGSTAVQPALEAAELLGVDDPIRRLPEGYQTRVGDGAEMDLPVGLKQGIGMARALARKPRIILFDEANGGLDSAADSRLRTAMEKLKGSATIIIVSHRPSLLSLADRRFDLRGGRLHPKEDRRPDQAPKAASVSKIADAKKEGDSAARNQDGQVDGEITAVSTDPKDANA